MGDYKNDFLVVGIIFPVLAGLSVALRFKARFLAKQKLLADDWLALAALIFAWAWTVVVLVDTRIGNLGGHTAFDEEGFPIVGEWAAYFSVVNYAITVIWNPTVGLTKLSIAFLYKRIFATYAFHIVAWITIALLIGWTLAFTLADIFPCTPIQRSWDTEETSNCINFPAMYTASVASNIATDVLVLVIPIYNVWSLHMPLRRKVAVVLIFALGSFVIVTGIIRLKLLVGVYSALEDPTWRDLTYEYGPPILWTVVELNLGVICACLPLMRPVWRAAKDSPAMTRFLKSFTLSYRSSDTDKPGDEMELGIVNKDSGSQLRLVRE